MSSSLYFFCGVFFGIFLGFFLLLLFVWAVANMPDNDDDFDKNNF